MNTFFHPARVLAHLCLCIVILITTNAVRSQAVSELAPGSEIVEVNAAKQTTLTWDPVEGCSSYVLLYNKEGSAVWSRSPVYLKPEATLPLFKGVYRFKVIGNTPEGFSTDPSDSLTVNFVEPDWQ